MEFEILVARFRKLHAVILTNRVWKNKRRTKRRIFSTWKIKDEARRDGVYQIS